MLANQAIRDAFAAMGKCLRIDHAVDILVVGGAAGILTGELPESWATQDVDIIHCHFPGDRDAVLDAAAAITRPLFLPPGWMNDFGGLYAWTLPEDWKSRRVLVGTYGMLRVHAAGRFDLIAMKFVAHRTRDLEHLAQLRVTRKEAARVTAFLKKVAKDHPEHHGQIAMAHNIVHAWETIS